MARSPFTVNGKTILSWALNRGAALLQRRSIEGSALKDLREQTDNKRMHVGCPDTPQPRKSAAGKRGRNEDKSHI